MSIPFENDLHMFMGDFAENVQFTLESEEKFNVRGVFDNPFNLIQLGEAEIESTESRLTCVESDIAPVQVGNTVLIRNKVYDVVCIEPDGTGMAVVKLAESYD